VQYLDLAQLGDNVFRLLTLSSHSVVLLFAEILSDFRLRGWTTSKGLAQFCIGHPDILGPTDAPIRLEEMANLPLAMLQSGSLSRALINRPAELARLEAAAQIQLASIAGTLCAMRDGLACTLAPKVLVSEDLAAGRLTARRVIDPTPMRTLYLVTQTEARPTFLREHITALIADLVGQAATNAEWAGARIATDPTPA
jgi:LysR family nitrogen assimilation transcriptional regulator